MVDGARLLCNVKRTGSLHVSFETSDMVFGCAPRTEAPGPGKKQYKHYRRGQTGHSPGLGCAPGLDSGS